MAKLWEFVDPRGEPAGLELGNGADNGGTW